MEIEEAFDTLTNHLDGLDCLNVGVEEAIMTIAREADKFITPSKVIHIIEDYSAHDWEKEEDGSIDFWAFCSDYHNGPRCKRCGYTFCEYDDDVDVELKKPCHIEKYLCPHCHEELSKCDKYKYCPNCGQLLDWEEK